MQAAAADQSRLCECSRSYFAKPAKIQPHSGRSNTNGATCSLKRADRNAEHPLVRQHCKTKQKCRSNTAELACATIDAEESAAHEAAQGRTDAIRHCGTCFRARLALDAAYRRLRRRRSARAGGIAVVLPTPSTQQWISHASAGERQQGGDFGGQDGSHHPHFVVRSGRRGEAF